MYNTMAQSNLAEQYQHRIADIIQRFVNSMTDSRARIDINSSREEDGFWIVELTLWRCRSCPDHLYLFRTLFYIRRQYDITNLQRHLDAIVLTYSVSPRSDSSTADAELTQAEFNSGSDSYSDSDIEITGYNSRSQPMEQPTSTSEQFNRWSPTASEANSECIIIDVDSDSSN